MVVQLKMVGQGEVVISRNFFVKLVLTVIRSGGGSDNESKLKDSGPVPGDLSRDFVFE